MQVFVIFSLLIAVLGVILALQNTTTTTVTFLAWTFQGSLALILLIALLTGAFVSFLASLPTLFGGKWTVRSQKKKLTELESSLKALKSELEEAKQNLQDQGRLGVRPKSAPSLSATQLPDLPKESESLKSR